MGFGHRSRSSAQTTYERTYDVLPNPDIFQSYRHARSGWREGKTTMTDEPVELDEHRGMAAQKSTETRRRRHAVKADQAALQRRQEEFERHAVAAPSASWSEAAVKARYLIELFVATPEARNPRRRRLIAKVLDDFVRLSRLSESGDSVEQ
jgi:hypothetical protein